VDTVAQEQQQGSSTKHPQQGRQVRYRTSPLDRLDAITAAQSDNVHTERQEEAHHVDDGRPASRVLVVSHLLHQERHHHDHIDRWKSLEEHKECFFNIQMVVVGPARVCFPRRHATLQNTQQ